MASVVYLGGILALNVRSGRGATLDEHRSIATRAGYPDLRGITGLRAERRSDGMWLTFVGRRELEESARYLGLELPDDLAW